MAETGSISFLAKNQEPLKQGVVPSETQYICLRKIGIDNVRKRNKIF